MAVWSIITKNHIEGLIRLDPEFYEPRFLDRKVLYDKIKIKKRLIDVAVISTGPAYSSEQFAPNNEIPIAKIGDVTNNREFDEWEKLSRHEFARFNEKKIENESILFTMTGDPPDIGKCIYIKYDNLSLIGYNQRVCKIRVKRNVDLSSQLLYTYLSNELVRLQTERVGLGIRQRNVSIKDINNIIIVPIKDDTKEVDWLINEYVTKKEEAKSNYSHAESLLLEELGLKDFKPKDELFYEVYLSEAKSVNRIDAEYFKPKYEKVNEILNRFDMLKLDDTCSTINYGTVPTSPYVENPKDGIPYVKGEDLQRCFIDYSKLVYLDKETTKKLPAKFYIKENDIIISQMGTVGNAGLVTKQEEGWLFASFTIRVRFKEEIKKKIDPLFATLYIQNISRPYYLLRKIAHASVRQNTDLPTIRGLEIPLLPISTQKSISDMIRQSHEARKKAKELLDEAKRKVEEAVEQEAGVR